MKFIIVAAFITAIAYAVLPVVVRPCVIEQDGIVVDYKIPTVTGFKSVAIPEVIPPGCHKFQRPTPVVPSTTKVVRNK